MKLFKVGDIIICPEARVPSPCEIVGIDWNNNIYLFQKEGSLQPTVPFDASERWILVEENEFTLQCDKIKQEIGLI